MGKIVLAILVVFAASAADVIISFAVFTLGALLGAGLLVVTDLRQRAHDRERRHFSRRTS